MEHVRLEFLRVLVESHLVESVLKCLDGVEVESLTVRNVQETRYEDVRRLNGRFVTSMLAQMDIFACDRSREIIVRRIEHMRKPYEMEVTCQVVRSSFMSRIDSPSHSFAGLDVKIRHDASKSAF